MKVLKHGRYYVTEGIMNCDCGCKFEYTNKDIYIAVTNESMLIENKYVKCPECNKLISILR